MVAPNSPSARAKHKSTPAITPGKASGKVTVKNTRMIGPKRRGGVFKPSIDRFEGEPDRANHERKAHDAAGQRRAGPAERENDAEMFVQEGADRSPAAEPDEQEIAGDDGRQHQRQENKSVDTDLPQKFLRANSQPIAMPNGSAHAVATIAMRSDSPTAVHSAGERSNSSRPWLSAHDVGLTRKEKP